MKIDIINRKINSEYIDKYCYLNLEVSFYTINYSSIKLSVKISYIYFNLIIFSSEDTRDFDI